jgi:hypothetical protein
MAVGKMAQSTLREERAEASRLAWAFGVSLALHLLFFGTYQAGKKFAWWQNWHWPTWVRSSKVLAQVFPKPESPRSLLKKEEAPLLFVDVNPAQSSAESPPDTKYYSDKNSVAANPNAKKDTGVPVINGAQTQVVKTEDVPREKFTPLQPSPPVAPPKEAQEELKAKPTQTPGDLTIAKPDLTPHPDEGQAAQSRPRTVKEAKARLQNNRLPGEKMKQEGGVKRYAELTSLDVKATPFGAYDAALIDAISHRWYSLLDARDYASDRRGKVVLQFSLHADGRVTGMNVAENTAGEVLGLICEKAVLDPAPFAAWPSDMRRMMGETRNIQFTFYYN